MASTTAPIIVLFRNDLRISDNKALSAAAERGGPVVPLFILSPEGSWQPGGATRWWLHHSPQAHCELAEPSALILRRGAEPTSKSRRRSSV